MKKNVEVKFPNSANLFQFCRKVLDHKFGGIRVIDQDVGQILGFDPADCSHWKKGKKNIRSIQAIKSIADNLGIDEKLVVDIASGDIDETEAYNEFHGYGSFEVSSKVFDAAKKDFYRKNASTWTRDKEAEFKTHFETNATAIKRIVDEIHEKINFSEAPLYLPEVVGHYPEISLEPSDQISDLDAVSSKEDGKGKTSISYQAGREVRPYMRFKIAKEIGGYFLKKNNQLPPSELEEHGNHIFDVQSNLFAAYLITPETLIRQEMKNVNVSKDLITQLAEVFWVSKSFMNIRLKEILQK